MNKGVIVQLENNIAHVLKSDGGFVSCHRDPRWQIGDVITLSRRPWLSLKTVLISCAVFLCLTIIIVIVFYQVPTTYIEISVNPSVQLTLNRFDRVLSVGGLNEDGKKLLDGMTYNNLSLEEAYLRLFNQLENNGHLSDAVIQLVIANSSYRKIYALEKALQDLSGKYIQTNNMRFYTKRYVTAEYLSMTHPLPFTNLPDARDFDMSVPDQESSGQQAESQQPNGDPNTRPNEESQSSPPSSSNEHHQVVPDMPGSHENRHSN